MLERIKADAIMIPAGFGPLVARALKSRLRLIGRTANDFFGEQESAYLKFAETRVLFFGLELAYYLIGDKPGSRFETITLGFNTGWMTLRTGFRELEAWGKRTAVSTYPYVGIDVTTPGWKWYSFAYETRDMLAVNLHVYDGTEMVEIRFKDTTGKANVTTT